MSKTLSAKYYQESKETVYSLQKSIKVHLSTLKSL